MCGLIYKKDGDVLKLPGVNFSDGFNILTLRMKHEEIDYPNVFISNERGIVLALFREE